MSLESNAVGDRPEVAATAFVHPSATLIGKVAVKRGAFIGPGAVLRADEPGPDGTVSPITVGEYSNVQDCAVVHALGGTEVTIGARSSVAHAAVVHGPCKIGAECFIGFNSVVFNAVLDTGVIVMHQALVENIDIPAGLLVPSKACVRCEEDLRHLQPPSPEIINFARNVARTNTSLAQAALNRNASRSGPNVCSGSTSPSDPES
jgi:carbonic anhydrase/acetyltransferase-like protein (isoleucine patch superfamily)